jgi:predicted O-methyltransferase YrrM
VWWGDACSKFEEVASKYGPIEFLLLDGVPKETLGYLKAAEPYLAEGAVVVADNAGEMGRGKTERYDENDLSAWF